MNVLANSMKQTQTARGLLFTQVRCFTGKTESGFKFKTPKMRMRVVHPVYPPPGLNLQIPEGLTPETFCNQIGGDCAEYADKFETIDELFNLTSRELRAKGLPTVQRKYLLHCREMLRRGVLTFEYLSRRTCLEKVRDK